MSVMLRFCLLFRCNVPASQVFRHRLGERESDPDPVLHERDSARFLALSATKDGRYVTINANAKTSSEVRSPMRLYALQRA